MTVVVRRIIPSSREVSSTRPGNSIDGLDGQVPISTCPSPISTHWSYQSAPGSRRFCGCPGPFWRGEGLGFLGSLQTTLWLEEMGWVRRAPPVTLGQVKFPVPVPVPFPPPQELHTFLCTLSASEICKALRPVAAKGASVGGPC